MEGGCGGHVLWETTSRRDHNTGGSESLALVGCQCRTGSHGSLRWTSSFKVYEVCAVCVECLFLRTPSRAPYRTPPSCANRAAYPDHPPVVPDPESIDSQADYRWRHSTPPLLPLPPGEALLRAAHAPPQAGHRLKLSRGKTAKYFRLTQFGIEGCLFLLFGSTLVVKISKTQESTPSVPVMPKKNNRDKENIILPLLLPVVSPSRHGGRSFWTWT